MKKTFKKHKFDACVDTAMIRIISHLKDENFKVKSPSWSTIIVDVTKENIKSVKALIKNIICSIFNCDKATKYCRINILEDRMYVRFKTV